MPSDQAFLLTFAGLLRVGILADPVPTYRACRSACAALGDASVPVDYT